MSEFASNKVCLQTMCALFSRIVLASLVFFRFTVDDRGIDRKMSKIRYLNYNQSHVVSPFLRVYPLNRLLISHLCLFSGSPLIYLLPLCLLPTKNLNLLRAQWQLQFDLCRLSLSLSLSQGGVGGRKKNRPIPLVGKRQALPDADGNNPMFLDYITDLFSSLQTSAPE